MKEDKWKFQSFEDSGYGTAGSKQGVPNFFRGEYPQNRSIKDRESFFSPRAKDVDTQKLKPKILTGRLPAAFNVEVYDNEVASQPPTRVITSTAEEKSSNVDISNKVYQNTDGPPEIDSGKRYGDSGETRKSSFRESIIDKKKSSTIQQSHSNPYKNFSSSLKKVPPISQQFHREDGQTIEAKPTYIIPPAISKAEDTEITETPKKVMTKPYYLRGSSASNGRYNKNFQNIVNLNSIKNDQPKIAPKMKLTSLAEGASKTISNFLPKIKLDEESRRSHRNEDIQLSRAFNTRIVLEDGITYKTKNNFKYYFYIPTIDLFLLKEVSFSNSNALQQKIIDWNMNIKAKNRFLEIVNHYVNVPEGYITVLLEHPMGENLNDIVSSLGLLSENILHKISNQIIEIININNVISQKTDFYFDWFCMCDIYLDINENVKIVPNIFNSFEISSKTHSKCECKTFLKEFSKVFGFTLNNFFCLGYILLKCITRNVRVKAFEIILKNRNEMCLKKYCCLLHALMQIEKETLKNNKDLFIADFLQDIPSDLIEFMCLCLSFSESNKSYLSFISSKWICKNLDVENSSQLTMKEMIKLVKGSGVHLLNIQDFMKNYEIIYSNILSKNEGIIRSKYEYKKTLSNREDVILMLCNWFDIDKECFIEEIEKGLNFRKEKRRRNEEKGNRDFVFNGSENGILA